MNDLDVDLNDYIQEKIFNFRLAKGSKILKRLLESGMFLFLLDGYDEIYSKKVSKLTENLDTFIDKYGENTFIVSSRPGSGLEHSSISKNYYVQSLSSWKIESFIDKVTSKDQKILATKIKYAVRGLNGERFKHYLSNPLLLSMFILTYENFPELPNKISRFYWNVFDTLATKHNLKSKRGLYQHERKTLLKNDEIQEILRWFAYVTLFEGKFSFDGLYLSNKITTIKRELNLNFEVNDLIYDLTVAIGILLIDGMSYSFHHRSLQEYFASELIAGLDSSKAARVYREKIPALILSTTDGLSNFFNLCLENDERNFSDLFLLFHLQKLKEILTYEPNEDNVLIFFERSEYNWHFTPNDPYTLFCKNNPMFEVYKDILIYLGHNEVNSIMGINFKTSSEDIELLCDIARKEEPNKKIISETGMFDLNLTEIYEDEIVRDFISKFQIVSILHILEKQVDNQIQRLNKYLSKSDMASNSLLGF